MVGFLPTVLLLFALLFLPLQAVGQDAPDACTLITPADVRAAGAKLEGALDSDGSTLLDSRTVPGLPTPLRVGQCTGPATLANAITFRLGLLSAREPLSAKAWADIEKAVDDGKKDPADDSVETRIGTARCSTHSWQGGSKSKPVRLHEVGCSAVKGRHQLAITFEHEDRNKLPDLKVVKAVLDAALRRLP